MAAERSQLRIFVLQDGARVQRQGTATAPLAMASVLQAASARDSCCGYELTKASRVIPLVLRRWHGTKSEELHQQTNKGPRFSTLEHHSLPQGNEGNDYLYVTGSEIDLRVCPASAFPTALDLVFFRRAAAATTC